MDSWLSLADFTAARLALPATWQASERVIEPRLILIRSGHVFCARLYGRRVIRGKVALYPASGVTHNWVVDQQTIRPLPVDTSLHVAEILGQRNAACLSFADVVSILRNNTPDLIAVEADDSVFAPARSESEKLDADLVVPGLAANLYAYQARGIQWMLSTLQHTGGLLLADEMGLGKTIQIIALLLLDMPSQASPVLIVCPTSLIANWCSEIRRFAPEITLSVHRGPRRTGVSSGLTGAHVVITTYDTLVSDQSVFCGVHWSWLICDEAQALKNPDSGRHQAMASIPRRYCIPMTGTPVETSLLNLWALSELAIPGLLGARAQFDALYPDTENSARQLAQLTDPIVLRRTVADVAGDLPDRIDIDQALELTPAMAVRYTEIREEVMEQYPVAGALVATGQLALFCAHPWLQGKTNGPDEYGDITLGKSMELPLLTPKLERTVALIREAFSINRKVLVFAIFNQCGHLIQEAAGNELSGAYWGAINGSTPQGERQDIVDQFSEHEGPACLVLNPKAAGSGLNITAATVVIHYTQAWNPALEAQASARAHRRGQTQPVHVYRLYYQDTVERIMIERSMWRRELGNEAVPVSTRDRDDLRKALEILPESEEIKL